MDAISNARALIIDMDGVLWHGSNALPGLINFFQTLRQRDIRFILATNNASLTQDQYINKLAQMGVKVTRDEILTSGMATALYLAEHHNSATTRIFVVGEAGATQPLIEQGFTLTGLYEINKPDDTTQKGADIVVCGKDHTLTWDKLATATLNLRAGAKFIATNADTNADTTLPTEHGITQGNGAILAALQVASGVAYTTIGKPEPIMYQQAMKILGSIPDETIAIGDRLETDILGAVNANIRSIMVLTGISSEADLKTSDYQPTWVMPDIITITQALQEMA